MLRILLLASLILTALPVSARQLVLVQGYLSDAHSWRDAGITRELERQGWRFGGIFGHGSDGVRLREPPGMRNPAVPQSNAYYQVDIPTEAPITHQAYFLTLYLQRLRELYPQESIAIVGHSAGGVVARYVMVRQPQLGVDQLITIASPHLGTDSAEFGRLVGESPLALFAPLFGAGTLNRSQALYQDLLPEMPHRFLFWLNRQPHPEAEYVSIVREKNNPAGGDFIVPERSQYLENVYDLRFRARSYIVNGNHGLSPADGRLLLDLLSERRVPRIS